MRKMGIGLGVGINRSNYAQGIFNAYSARVVADGGVVESGTCVDAVSSLLQSASLLLIPSGYKGGKLYAEIPTNGNGDLTWTRGSDAFRTNASGLIQRVPWNLLQRSEELDNAVWIKSACSVTGNTTTAPNGTTTADKIVENSAVSSKFIYPSSVTSQTGTVYTYSIYAKAAERNWVIIGQDQSGTGYFWVDLTNGVFGATSGTYVSRSLQSVGNGWYRISITYSAISSSSVGVTFISSGNSVVSYQGDGTSGLFAWGAQLVEGTTAQTYLPTTDRLNFPRLSYMYGSCPSALLEPQRTNSIRNSTMVGASTSPSTLPTNYGVTGITATVVGIGTENGLSYVDIRFSGTASGTNTQVQLETTAAITASNGQTWTQSVYLKLINTSTPPIDYNMRLREGTAAGVFVADGIIAISPTTSLQRFTYTRTNTGALTERIQPILLFNQVAGNTYDYTIRIAQPQMELGAYVTTPIFTSGATATRVADSFSRNNIYTNGLISASGGTWFMELRNNVAYLRDSSSGFGIGDSSSLGTNSIFLRLDQLTSARLAIIKRLAGIPYTLYTTTTDTTKIAIKWNGTSADIFENGTKVVSATSFTATNMDFLAVGSAVGVGVPIFIQQMALFNSPLTDAQCQTLTT